MLEQLKEFEGRRVKYYKYNVRESFRKEAVNMEKMFSLYREEQRS